MQIILSWSEDVHVFYIYIEYIILRLIFITYSRIRTDMFLPINVYISAMHCVRNCFNFSADSFETLHVL